MRLGIPPWILVVAGGVFLYGLIAASWAGPISWLWVLLITGFILGELVTMYNGAPGDTASGHIWRWARLSLWRRAILLAVLLWLMWHFVLQPWMPL